MLEPLRAPKGPLLLLSLFAGEPDLEQIEGDLLEEFRERVPLFGLRSARKWYRREALRNAWAILTRSRVLMTLGAAALSVFAIRIITHPFLFWLKLQLASAPRIIGLRLMLVTLFQVFVTIAAGFAGGSFFKERGPILRLSFIGFFLMQQAYWLLIRDYYQMWILEPIRIPLDLTGSIIMLVSFGAGTLWAERVLKNRQGIIRNK